MTVENKPIDVGFLKSIVEDDIDFRKELFEIFTSSAKNHLEKMEIAIKTNDTNSWYMASHAFKGAAASIGAFELSKLLEYAQKHTEDNGSEKGNLLESVKKELEQVLAFIKSDLLS